MKHKVPTREHVVASRTFKARFSRDVLEPLEPLELDEGEEITLTAAAPATKPSPDWLERTAGSWAGSVDAQKLIREIYESRLLQTRSIPRL